jgi:hypothetical protein
MSFINEMKVLIVSDELAKDVAGAEALLEHHQEHKVHKLPQVLENVGMFHPGNNGRSPVNVCPKKACDQSNFCHVFLNIYVQFTWLVVISGH